MLRMFRNTDGTVRVEMDLETMVSIRVDLMTIKNPAPETERLWHAMHDITTYGKSESDGTVVDAKA
jgi:hypothetical protein